LSNKTILFADDSATMRTIVEKTFQAEPYNVACAASGEGAIAKAKELNPDVIIVDAGMPGVSGYDVCKAVRDDSVLNSIPVIIMSGVSNLYDESRGKAVGVTEHMKKPFDTGLLIDMIAGLVTDEQEDSLVEVEDVLEPVSDTPLPLPDLEPDLDRLSEIPIPETSMSEVPQAIGNSNFSDPFETEEKVGRQTRDYVRPSSVPIEPLASETESKDEDLFSDEEEFGEEADFGEDEPFDLSEPIENEEVSPIEIDSHPKDTDSGSFHVGTLAELAQMDSQGGSLQTEPHEDAIELKSAAASSLSSLGPAIAPMDMSHDEIETEESAEIQIDSDDRDDLTDESDDASRFGDIPQEQEAEITSKESYESVITDRAAVAAEELAAKVVGITPAQAAAIQTLTREIIEKVVWEVVPDLAEAIIKEELSKLLEE